MYVSPHLSSESKRKRASLLLLLSVDDSDIGLDNAASDRPLRSQSGVPEAPEARRGLALGGFRARGIDDNKSATIEHDERRRKALLSLVVFLVKQSLLRRHGPHRSRRLQALPVAAPRRQGKMRERREENTEREKEREKRTQRERERREQRR
jgi:hypothetical protein